MTPAQTKIKEWRLDPVLFVRDNFKVEPDLWQADALRAMGGEYNPRRRMCMKACTGPGKSTVLAWGGLHRLSCFADKGEHPKGAAISGEGKDNLRDNLWAELAKWRARSEFLTSAFEWTNEKIFSREHKETWFLSARSYAKDADAEAVGRSVSGLHSLYPFILLDEIGDMPITLSQKASPRFTGSVKDGAIFAAGNPTSSNGLLYHICQSETAQWLIITITADPDDPKRTPRVDIEHARAEIAKYGKDNPWIMATILGQFPPVGFNNLLSVDEVNIAMNRHYDEESYSFAQKRLGIDAARFGDDPWCIFARQGLRAYMPVEMRNPRSHEVAARVAMAKAKWGSEVEFFDGTGGYAAGAVDAMIQAGHSPIEIHFSGKARDPRFFNKRSEIMFLCAEWIKRGGWLPKDPGMVRELTAPTFTFQDGKFRIEEKEQIKKRINCSTNKFDSLALTFSHPEMPSSTAEYPFNQHNGKLLSEYDPFEYKIV
jgi:hypothetical protein